jgi:uncharacterized protein DUF4252
MCVALPGVAQAGKLELQNLEKLTKKASVVNDVTLDGMMLGLASKVLDMSGDADARQVKDAIKDVTGIYIKNFEFDDENQYDQADVQAIRAQLTRPGWSRIVGSVNRRTGEHSEIYILKEGDKVGGLAILVAEPRELTVVNIVGFVDVDKLSVLGGKFGIPDDIKNKSDDRSRHKPASHKSDKDKEKDKSEPKEHAREEMAE